PSAGSGTSNQPVSAKLSGLTANATYHYRLVAANASGTTNGADQTFTTSPAVSTAPQGSWVGTYGSAGYVLGAWKGSSDVSSLPNASVSLVQGTRFVWNGNTGDVRGLQSPDQSTREAATYYDPNQLQLHVQFSSA